MSGPANTVLPPSAKPPVFAVVGLGALGRLYAAALQQAGVEVYGVSRQANATCHYLLQQGERQQQVQLTPPPAHRQPDYLLLTTKAQHALTAVQQWRELFAPHSVLILLHNGLGTLAPLTALLGPTQTILQATSSHGALRVDEQLLHTGQGQTIIGPGSGPMLDKERRQQLLNALNTALPPASWQPEIEQALWLKLAVNAVINPLTALHQCRNGELQQPHHQQQIAQLVDELALLYERLALGLTRPQLAQTISHVIAATANNYSSMNRDLAAGRETEIEAISGVLLHAAATQGLALAEHQRLYLQICAASGSPPSSPLHCR